MSKISACHRVSLMIREDIYRGRLHAGTILIEAELTEKYKVSRNTLRDAFQLLIHQGLVTQEANKSARIKRMKKKDIIDLYYTRRLLEVSALDNHKAITTNWINNLERIINKEEKAALSAQGRKIGTYSLDFHRQIIALHESPRINQLFLEIIPQIRLIFVSGPLELSFQAPWINRELKIWHLLQQQNFAKAKLELKQYLQDSEKLILENYTDYDDYTTYEEVNYGLPSSRL